MSSLLARPVRYSHTKRSAAVAAPPAGAGRHISALDGIRGVAVLLVLIFHVFQVEPAPSHPLLRMGYAATLFGQTGVDLFFVLSGFLITGILLDTKSSRRYFVNFYGRRTLRILPLYYGSLVVFLVVLPRLVDFHASGIPPIWFWTFSTNVAVTQGLDPGELGHYWTLAIEEQFYLVWPLVVFALGRVALMRVCMASLVAAAALRMFVESRGISCFMITFCRIDTLLLGALLALVARSPRGLASLAARPSGSAWPRRRRSAALCHHERERLVLGSGRQVPAHRRFLRCGPGDRGHGFARVVGWLADDTRSAAQPGKV